MNEDVVSAKEFQIKNLQNQLDAVKKERTDLQTRLDNVIYFSILSIDLMENSRKKILAASRGEAEKPILKMDHTQNSEES